jgi:2-polyprenyl-3-methyl-5-hydroxy-6-metoxy-1,4-benzoquinol methylase
MRQPDYRNLCVMPHAAASSGNFMEFDHAGRMSTVYIPGMDKKYWDKVARDYDGEIFDSLASDRNGTIIGHIDRIGRRHGKNGVACDLGCGVGKYLPALARRFSAVHGTDLSDECVRQARAAHGQLKNVTIHQGDLSMAMRAAGPVDFALCTNVLIMPSEKMRAGILKRLAAAVRPGGSLLLLVPALESALYAHVRRAEWLRRSPKAKVIASTTLTGVSGRDIFKGILGIDGVRTKHWLREELIAALGTAGFEVDAVEKAEYDWKTEFHSPPRWMKAPYPWDWVAVGTKK